MRHSEEGLFPALEAALKAATEPLDCQALYDMPSIREHAASANRVSDYLGGLWRKGKVVRLPAPKTDSSRSRWVYAWKGSKGPKLHANLQAALEYTPRVLADRPSVLITEEGSTITIEMPNLMVIIKAKPPA
jgi:hypothetical protein